MNLFAIKSIHITLFCRFATVFVRLRYDNCQPHIHREAAPGRQPSEDSPHYLHPPATIQPSGPSHNTCHSKNKPCPHCAPVTCHYKWGCTLFCQSCSAFITSPTHFSRASQSPSTGPGLSCKSRRQLKSDFFEQKQGLGWKVWKCQSRNCIAQSDRAITKGGRTTG